MRKLHRVELLVVDDLALHRLEATETGDFYELIVERHRTASTIPMLRFYTEVLGFTKRRELLAPPMPRCSEAEAGRRSWLSAVPTPAPRGPRRQRRPRGSRSRGVDEFVGDPRSDAVRVRVLQPEHDVREAGGDGAVDRIAGDVGSVVGHR
jgi:hypothetical protein